MSRTLGLLSQMSSVAFQEKTQVYVLLVFSGLGFLTLKRSHMYRGWQSVGRQTYAKPFSGISSFISKIPFDHWKGGWSFPFVSFSMFTEIQKRRESIAHGEFFSFSFAWKTSLFHLHSWLKALEKVAKDQEREKSDSWRVFQSGRLWLNRNTLICERGSLLYFNSLTGLVLSLVTLVPLVLDLIRSGAFRPTL